MKSSTHTVTDLRLAHEHKGTKAGALWAHGHLQRETLEYQRDVDLVIRGGLRGVRSDAMTARRDFFASHTDKALHDADLLYSDLPWDDFDFGDDAECDCPEPGMCIWCTPIPECLCGISEVVCPVCRPEEIA